MLKGFIVSECDRQGFFGSVFAFLSLYWKCHIVGLKALTIEWPIASKVGANDSGVDNKAGDYISTSR